MATVTQISYSIRDADGNRASLLIPVPSATLFDDVSDFAVELAPLVDAVIEGVIVSITATYDIALPGGLDTDPEADSNVQKSGLFSFDVTGHPRRYGIRVPALDETKFTGKEVDTVDTDIAALTSALIDGLTENTHLVAPCDAYGNDLAALFRAVKVFRKA